MDINFQDISCGKINHASRAAQFRASSSKCSATFRLSFHSLALVFHDENYWIRGNVSYWWNGGGEGSVHSSVVAPSPHGFPAALSLRENACAMPTKNTIKPTAEI